jgi:hypothetical protein
MIESEFRQRKKERQKKKQTKATDFFDWTTHNEKTTRHFGFQIVTIANNHILWC